MDDDLLALVRRMRMAQRAWFRHHRGEDLAAAMRLEKEVDIAVGISEVTEVAPPAEDGLFDEDLPDG